MRPDDAYLDSHFAMRERGERVAPTAEQQRAVEGQEAFENLLERVAAATEDLRAVMETLDAVMFDPDSAFTLSALEDLGLNATDRDWVVQFCGDYGLCRAASAYREALAATQQQGDR